MADVGYGQSNVSPGQEPEESKGAAQRRAEQAGATSHGASQIGSLVTSGLSVEDRRRVEHLEASIICACPRENWSKTLANCPDGCADQQKLFIRDAVRSGKSDGAVFEAMVAAYSGKVLAAPPWSGSGKWSYILPLAGFVVIVGAGAYVVSRWRQPFGHGVSREESSVTDEERARVLRELEETE